MHLQMTPTQQSTQQKPRGGKLDSENSQEASIKQHQHVPAQKSIHLLHTLKGQGDPRYEGQLLERRLGILGVWRSREAGASGFYSTLCPKAPLIPSVTGCNNQKSPELMNKATCVLCPEKSAMHVGNNLRLGRSNYK